MQLGGIQRKDGGRLLQPVIEGFEQVPHRLQSIIIEQRSHPFPKPTFAPQFGPDRLEQRAAHLYDLIQ